MVQTLGFVLQLHAVSNFQILCTPMPFVTPLLSAPSYSC